MFYLKLNGVQRLYDTSLKQIMVAAYQFERQQNKVNIELVVHDFLEPVLDRCELVYCTNRYEDHTNLMYNGRRINKLRDIEDIRGCEFKMRELGYNQIFKFDIEISCEIVRYNWVKNGF